ncbi:MAG: hypothetical protein ACLRZH_03250 [Ruthenibacterium lactatiformans]
MRFPHRPRARFYPYAEYGRPLLLPLSAACTVGNPAADFYRMQSTGRWSGLWMKADPNLVLRHSTAPAWALGLFLKAMLKAARTPPDGKEKFLNAYA